MKKKKAPVKKFLRRIGETNNALKILQRTKTGKEKSSEKSRPQYARLAEKLFIATGTYIYESAENELQVEAANEFTRLTEIILQKLHIEEYAEEYHRDRQIAYFLQALMLCGPLPRNSTIPVIAKWLDMGNSTIRTAHERTRKAEPELFKSDTETFLKKTWVDLLYFLEDTKKLPCPAGNGKIKEAYKKLIKRHQISYPHPRLNFRQKHSA